MLQVFDQYNNQVSETLSCTPTSEFKCQILWTIPEELLPGTYTIKVSDSIISRKNTFEHKIKQFYFTKIEKFNESKRQNNRISKFSKKRNII